MSNPDPPSEPHDGDEIEVIKEFPYELLKNEMREAILKNIHDPQDKLNVLKALPLQWNTERLMYWDYTSLQFELIYPLVYPYLKWPYETDETSWTNVLSLCKVSPEFQRIVITHYEKHINLTHLPEKTFFQDYRQEPIWAGDPLKGILKAACDKNSPPWHKTIPFGIATCFTTATGRQVKLLKKLGKRLWSFEFSLVYAYDKIPGLVNFLVQCLHLVPNLRRLGLADHNSTEYYKEGSLPLVQRGERLVLPELPFLKNITLIGDCSICQQWILPKYSRQLEVLDFQDCYLTEDFNSKCFPNLETIHIDFDKNQSMEYENANIGKVNGLLNKFLLSPLKEITVVLDEVDIPKFFNFMVTLSHFGETLQTLEMKFGRMNVETGVEVKKELRGWISQLKFPKLSLLHLVCYVGPLEFLLKMPALKVLNIVARSLESLHYTNVKGLQFSLKKEDMLESPIWQLFPKLEWFQIIIVVYRNVWSFEELSCDTQISIGSRTSITRDSYEKHQRIKARAS